MSFVTAQPEAFHSAAIELENIGAILNSENTAAMTPTTAIAPTAADEVSALTAAQFAAYAQLYQTISAQAAAIHEQFLATLRTSGQSYALTEAANAAVAG